MWAPGKPNYKCKDTKKRFHLWLLEHTTFSFISVFYIQARKVKKFWWFQISFICNCHYIKCPVSFPYRNILCIWSYQRNKRIFHYEMSNQTWLYLVVTRQLQLQYNCILCNATQDKVSWPNMVAAEAENKQAGQSHRKLVVSPSEYWQTILQWEQVNVGFNTDQHINQIDFRWVWGRAEAVCVNVCVWNR